MDREFEPLRELITRVALVEQLADDLRNRTDKAADRRWALVPATIGAILGGTIALVGQIIVKHFWP